MDNIEKLKLSNVVAMKILKNDFPINGKTTVTIIMKNNMPDSIDIKNSNAKAIQNNTKIKGE